MLIATRDKYLYAFDTTATGKPTWGQFRGNDFNTGVSFDEIAEAGQVRTCP